MADISKAKQLLNYVPTVSAEEGLKKTFEWYRSEIGSWRSEVSGRKSEV
jgi:nucleoside-diphosphate-sugar epimerase